MSAVRYRAVMFDLLTGLLDSWSLWNQVTGSAELGIEWRKRYLVLTYEAGSYRSYEGIIREAATDTGISTSLADELMQRWHELPPWPETQAVLQSLSRIVPVAVATNCSRRLAEIAVRRVGVSIPVVVTAEEAGCYKPRPEMYRLALESLDGSAAEVLFVAGSASDVPGAAAAGMPVYWHNRMKLSSTEGAAPPEYLHDSLWPLVDLLRSA